MEISFLFQAIHGFVIIHVLTFVLIVIGAAVAIGMTRWMVRAHLGRRFIAGMWFAFIVTTILGAALVVYDRRSQQAIWAEFYLNETEVMASLTETMGHAAITARTTPEDLTYQTIIAAHERFGREFSSIGYIYTLRLIGPEKAVFVCSCPCDVNQDGVIDGEWEQGEELYSPYNEWFPVFGEAFAGRRAIDWISKSSYGAWITAAVPLHDASGEIEAILAIDFYPKRWFGVVSAMSIRSMAVLVVLMMVVFISFRHAGEQLISIRRLRETNDALLAAQESAAVAAQAKQCFLANINHEIRTPMNAIVGLTRMIHDKLRPHTPPDILQETRDLMRLVQRNGDSLLSLIDGILELSQFDVPNVLVTETWFSMTHLADEMMEKVAGVAQKKELATQCLTPTDPPLWLKGDATKIARILWHLLDNAVKFTAHGEVRLKVSASPLPPNASSPKLKSKRRSGDETHEGEGEWMLVALRVSDTGVGIPQDKQEQLFHAFSQIDASMTRRYGGVGIGLAIVSRLSEMVGGHIAIESTVGVGSTFVLEFPALVHGGPPKSLSPDAGFDTSVASLASFGQIGSFCFSVSADEASPLQGMKVLIVEDTRINQIVLTSLLSDAGARVDLADNGQIGVDKVTGGDPFDVILMDLQMPVLDGYEATRQLRTGGFVKPIIAVTAHAINEERDRALAAGCDAFITKPVDRQLLLNTMVKLAHSAPRTL